MQLQEIRYVLAIAECRSFSKAAGQLFVSQPALSKAIKRLEEELETPLFIRELNNVYPTTAGIFFIERAKKIINATDKLKDEMLDFRNSSLLRLGISTFYGKYYLPLIIPKFKEKYPDITVEIVEDVSLKLEQMTLNKHLDLCMVPKPLTEESLTFSKLRTEEILLAVPAEHPFNKTNKRGPVNPIIFAKDKWIFLNKKQRFSTTAYKICENAGFKPDVVFDTMNWDTVINMISIGEGVGFTPDLKFGDTGTPKPIYYTIKSKFNTREYGTAFLSDSSKADIISAFTDTARECFKNIVSGEN